MNQTAPRPPPQPAPATRQRFLAEFLDAFDRRTFLLVIAVLLIQAGFVLSYVGAFHDPSPHRVPIAVLAPAEISGHLVSELNAIHGHPLHAAAVADESIGRTLLRHGSTSGLLIINPRAKTDALLVAGGGGTATATAVQDLIARTEAAQRRHAMVTDAVPAQPGDARGLSGFYLVVGWLVGGYLVAALLGIATRPRPATTRRAIIRLIVLVPYAILSGLAGAIIVGPVLGALTGHLIAISALGALIVYCAATVTMGFQVLLGTLGVGLVPAYRGRGLGSRLIEAALERARAAGFVRIELDVYADNARAIALYERLGFVREGVVRDAVFVDGEYRDAIAMALVERGNAR